MSNPTKTAGLRAPLLTGLTTLALLFTASGALTAEEVVARIGDLEISMTELEQAVAGQLEQIDRQRHLLLEGSIGPLVDQKLIEMESQKRGISLQELLEAEVNSKAGAVSPEDVDAWYNENRGRVGNQTKEQLAGQIEMFLVQQNRQQRSLQFLKDLRKEYGVEIVFEPLRVDLDLTNATWKGKENAPITVVEFSDFQCPACKGFNPTLTDLLAKYPEQVRIAFLNNPLRDIHPQAQKAAEAALCARDQDKFWELHDLMFNDQRRLEVDNLKMAAQAAGVDQASFDECLDSGRYATVVQQDLDQGNRVGVSGTPSVFINGRIMTPGRVPTLQQLSTIIDDELSRSNSSD